MPIPGADSSVVPPEKVTDYLLDVSHPVGGPKARWLLALGYDPGQPDQLANDLLNLVHTSEQFVAEPTSFGVKYKVKGALTSPTGQIGKVVSVWIIETGSPQPRLVTVVPDKERKA
jgi:hypothetical protein